VTLYLKKKKSSDSPGIAVPGPTLRSRKSRDSDSSDSPALAAPGPTLRSRRNPSAFFLFF